MVLYLISFWPNLVKVKGIWVRIHVQRLARAPGVEFLGRALAVSCGRLLWQKLTLLLFQTVIFNQTDFWFLFFGKQYSVCYAGASFVHKT